MTFFFYLHLPFVLCCLWFELVSVNGLFCSSLSIVSHRNEDLRVWVCPLFQALCRSFFPDQNVHGTNPALAKSGPSKWAQMRWQHVLCAQAALPTTKPTLTKKGSWHKHLLKVFKMATSVWLSDNNADRNYILGFIGKILRSANPESECLLEKCVCVKKNK